MLNQMTQANNAIGHTVMIRNPVGGSVLTGASLQIDPSSSLQIDSSSNVGVRRDERARYGFDAPTNNAEAVALEKYAEGGVLENSPPGSGEWIHVDSSIFID